MDGRMWPHSHGRWSVRIRQIHFFYGGNYSKRSSQQMLCTYAMCLVYTPALLLITCWTPEYILPSNNISNTLTANGLLLMCVALNNFPFRGYKMDMCKKLQLAREEKKMPSTSMWAINPVENHITFKLSKCNQISLRMMMMKNKTGSIHQ